LKSTKIFSFAGYFFVLMAIVVISGCSTKKNTFIRRAYHNLTSHYNVYWNGMDNMRQGKKDFEAGLTDNFSLIIPVYNFGDKASSGKISQYADIAIKKASKTIQKHSMVFNRKEYVKWIDDSYLLIGKAYFYKQDYPMARRTFEFVIKTYNTNDIKYEAMLWQALSNIQLGDYNRAEPMLDMLQSKIKQGQAPNNLETDLNLAYGQFFILQKNYASAVPFIERALELNPDRNMETRCYFILAQIHQQNGELQDASRLYEKVIKRNPQFEMEFNAKINLAQCYDTKAGNRDYIIKKLTRMLKDDKNKELLDQVYYSLAQITLRDGDTVSTISYLKKSVSESKKNNYQKAISSLQLADIYFVQPDYPNSQAYYDSTMQFLPKDFAGYKELQKKTSTLTDLVTNLKMISLQDSLQKLATMTEEERNIIIDKIINKLIAEEIKKRQEEQEKAENLNMFGPNRDQQSSTNSTGRWYFYNPTTMANGFTSFSRKWGRRKLEDNWFLSDKNMVAVNNEEIPDTLIPPPSGADSTKQAKGVIPKSNNPKERNFYLQNVPFTKQQKDVSDEKMIHAYYKSGFIYYEGLGDFGRAIGAFETLQDRFPDNMFKVQSDYMLYTLYNDLENKPKSDTYKNQILNKYPESDYAKLLINPNYYKEINSHKSDAARLYESTYLAYTNQQYYMVINNADLARNQYKSDSVLMPRFDYLRGLALGKIEVVDSLAEAMYQIIKNYPKSEVKGLAQDVLNFLGKQRNSQGEPIVSDSSVLLDAGLKLYKFNPDALHFYLLIVDGNRVDVDALKVKISDFNQKYHDLENLQVNSLLLDNSRQMITVNNFENSEKALNYLINIRDSKYVFIKLETTGGYSDFVISTENYPVFYRNKDISQYIRFFEKYYPVKK
jgi:tetratricopeptide (TPR) repeat protein